MRGICMGIRRPFLGIAPALLMATSLFAGASAQVRLRESVPPELQEAIDRVEDVVALEFAKEPVGSVTVGIVSGSKLLWAASFGFADMERRILATPDSVYRIGSITKQFTALMLLQLAEAGKVRLSDPVQKHLPEVSRIGGRFPDAPEITLAQLATMTSGLGREPQDLPTYLQGSVADWENVMISALAETRFRYEPDTRYHYSNIGYAILGAALARAAGQPFTEYVAQQIFAPLGMRHTSFEPNADIEKHLGKGYQIQRTGEIDSETPAREHQGRGYKVPNGAVYSTVSDLAKFISFELGYGPETVLKKDFLEDNLNRVASATGDLTSGYGIGFRVFRRRQWVIYGHGGSVAGYRASALFERESQCGVVVLRNAGGRLNVSELAQRILAQIAAAKSRSGEASKTNRE